MNFLPSLFTEQLWTGLISFLTYAPLPANSFHNLLRKIGDKTEYFLGYNNEKF